MTLITKEPLPVEHGVVSFRQTATEVCDQRSTSLAQLGGSGKLFIA